MITKSMEFIRNFSIIAHIDHGKSTLADRIIQHCGGLEEREMSTQVLDSMDIERERGITIKAQTAALSYQAKDGHTYRLNLIDTPGHVDFSYEVSRSLAACEGALLVVDASQGVEAQTVATCYTAIDQDLEVIHVLTKIDLPSADPLAACEDIEEVIGIDATDAIYASAKTGQGIEDILEAIVTRVPAPEGDPEAPLQALVIDSWFDNYVGVIMLIRIVNGCLKEKDSIQLMSNKAVHDCDQIGVFTPKPTGVKQLSAGEVGFIVTGIKELEQAQVGDTITHSGNKAAKEPLPGFQEIKPQVFAGLYPVDSHEYDQLRESLERLKLNDSALMFEPEVSQALGFGFRCGFLGLLHMEIVQERLEREFDMDIITTAPSVIYEVVRTDGQVLYVDSPSQMPEVSDIEEVREPIVEVNLLMPQDYVGPVMTLCNARRGIQKNMTYLGKQVSLVFEIPLAEIVLDFFDRLKSVSRGYASMDYEFLEYRTSDVVKVDLLINGDRVDALSMIVHRESARTRGREVATKMREIIPRQMFEIAIQAAIGNDVIARENVRALRKNVLAKCYGGDFSRKCKLLEMQKAGKKRMKQVGNVEIPQEAFLAILQVED